MPFSERSTAYLRPANRSLTRAPYLTCSTATTFPASCHTSPCFQWRFDDDGSAGTELTGSGYSRQAITFGAPRPGTGNAEQIANGNDIQFCPAAAYAQTYVNVVRHKGRLHNLPRSSTQYELG